MEIEIGEIIRRKDGNTWWRVISKNPVKCVRTDKKHIIMIEKRLLKNWTKEKCN